MRGVNVAVVGLLGAALYNPVWTTSVHAPGDFGIALVGFVLLTVWRAPPLVVVVISALGRNRPYGGYVMRIPRWRLALLSAVSATGLGTLLNLSASDAQEHHGSLQQEIAQVEQQVDSIEADAVAMMASLPSGGSHQPAALGKALFFDKNLSVNRNEACAFCHMPQTGFQGAIESLNLGAVAQPGSVRTRFSLRKAPSAAYAAFSPPLIYAEEPGQAKCVHCFIGGNFWDLRATGLRLQNPTAMQAEGSPVNPTECQSGPSLHRPSDGRQTL
jgi:hypothetical protein